MNILQLEKFKMTAELGNITEASKRLFVSQPSLSRTISELEKEIGFPLFERHNNKLHLNKDGEKILEYVNVIVKNVESIYTYAAVRNEEYAIVRVGLYSEVMKAVFSTSPYNCPYLTFVNTNHSELMRLLNNDDVDLIISPGTAVNSSESIVSTLLYEQCLKVIVPNSHPLAQNKEINISDLRDEKFIYNSNQFTETTSWLEQIFGVNNMKIQYVDQLDVVNWQNKLSDSNYLAFNVISNFSKYLSASSIMMNHKRLIPVTGLGCTRNIYVSYKEKKKDKLKTFLDYLFQL